MTYEQAIREATEYPTFLGREVNTYVYVRADGSYNWCTFQTYANSDIHPFQIAWSSDNDDDLNARWLETAMLWLQRQQEDASA